MCVENGVSGSYIDKSITVLPRKAYYSSQVSSVCVASVEVEIPALEMDGMIEQCECEFQAMQSVSALSCSSHG